MDTIPIPSELIDAARSTDWRAMPAAIAKYRAGGGSTAGTAFWEAAARACGCPTHPLRQRCSAYDVVIRNEEALGEVGVTAAWSRSYTQLEVIARIDQADHTLAMQLLASPYLSNSVASLRARLVETRATSGKASGLVQGHHALSVARTLVAQHLEGAGSRGPHERPRFVAWNGGNRFVSPSMVAAGSSGGTFTEAILVTAKGDKGSVHRALAKAAFESTFFDRYWIGVPTTGAHHAAVESGIIELGLSNVGLVVFDTEQAQASIVMDADRAPLPTDRRGLLHLPPYYFS